MHIIAITGSVAMGKSTALAVLRRAHIPTFDADKVAARAIAPGGRAADAFARAFPTIHSREDLWRLLEEDPEARTRLEHIIHPAVLQALHAFIKQNRRQYRPCIAIDIPLLFEAGWDRLADSIWVVSAPDFLQEKRVLGRPGMNRQRLALLRTWQYPDFHKRRQADMVIHTGLGKTTMARKIKARLIKELACVKLF